MTVRFNSTVKVPVRGIHGRFEEVEVEVTADISIIIEAVDDERNVLDLAGDMIKKLQGEAITAAHEGEGVV